MLSLIIAAVTIAIVVYLLVKGYYPQAALFIGGLILLTCTWVFGLGTLLPAKTTTHFGGFDVFKVFSDGFASRIGGLGLILWLMAFIMGSGNAAFFSFAPLVPPIAKTLGVSTVSLIFPLQVLVSFGRVSSPITAALIAISGIAGVSSFQVAKRTCIPMFVATIVSYAAYFLFWYHP